MDQTGELVEPGVRPLQPLPTALVARIPSVVRSVPIVVIGYSVLAQSLLQPDKGDMPDSG